jgi:hypothetical protein
MPARLAFAGFLQPPSVPPDPIGDSWRGLTGPQGPQGLQGPIGPAGAMSVGGLAASPSYDNDAQAAAGGVAVGNGYRNGNFVMVRLT